MTKKKEPTQLVKIKLPLDLIQALKEMAAQRTNEFEQ